MIHLLVDSESPGIKRNLFKLGLRSVGTRLLKEEEVPTPWTINSNTFVIKTKTLPQFFSDNPDIKPEGCCGAREFY